MIKILIPDTRYIPIVTECIDNLKKWGYQYDFESLKWDIRKMNALGLTCWKNDGKQLITTIVFNQGLISQEKSTIYDTVYHEIAHAIAGPNAEHGPKWQNIVADIRKRTGLKMNVRAESGDLDEQYEILGHDVTLICEKCGRIIGVDKEKYNSSKNGLMHVGCGGKLKLIRK